MEMSTIQEKTKPSKLRPSDICFSQNNINNHFRRNCIHGRRFIGETLDCLMEGRLSVTDIPMIQVCLKQEDEETDEDTAVGGKKAGMDEDAVIGGKKARMDEDVTKGVQKAGMDEDAAVGGKKAGMDEDVAVDGKKAGMDEDAAVGGKKAGMDEDAAVGGKKAGMDEDAAVGGKKARMDEDAAVGGKKARMDDDVAVGGKMAGMDEDAAVGGKKAGMDEDAAVGGKKAGMDEDAAVGGKKARMDDDVAVGGKKAGMDEDAAVGGKKAGMDEDAAVGGKKARMDEDATEGVKKAGMDGDVAVDRKKARWITEDNRRLWIFRHLERLGRCKDISFEEVACISPRKLSSENRGASVEIQGGKEPYGYWYQAPDVTQIDPMSVKFTQNVIPISLTTSLVEKLTCGDLDGRSVPSIVVWQDDTTMSVIDGNTRLWAFQKAKQTEIAAIVIKDRQLLTNTVLKMIGKSFTDVTSVYEHHEVATPSI